MDPESSLTEALVTLPLPLSLVERESDFLEALAAAAAEASVELVRLTPPVLGLSRSPDLDVDDLDDLGSRERGSRGALKGSLTLRKSSFEALRLLLLPARPAESAGWRLLLLSRRRSRLDSRETDLAEDMVLLLLVMLLDFDEESTEDGETRRKSHWIVIKASNWGN